MNDKLVEYYADDTGLVKFPKEVCLTAIPLSPREIEAYRLLRLHEQKILESLAYVFCIPANAMKRRIR